MEKKYDIILIYPKIYSPYQTIYLPFAILFLGKNLLNKGYRVFLFDGNVSPISTLKNVLKNNKILLVGISVFTGPVISEALKIANLVRRYQSQIKIIWGGIHPTLLPEQTLKHPLVDIVAIGEGEYILPELASVFENNMYLEEVKGIGYKDENNRLHFPQPRPVIKDWDKEVDYAWELIDIEKYIFYYNGTRSIHILTSRGCPFRCAFCYNLKVSNG